MEKQRRMAGCRAPVAKAAQARTIVAVVLPTSTPMTGMVVLCSGCPRFFVFLSSSSSAVLGCSRDVPPGGARVLSCSGCPRFFLSSSRFLSSSVLRARVELPGAARVLSCSGCPRFLEVSARSALSNSVEVLRSAPNGGRELPHLLAPEPDTSLHCNTHAPHLEVISHEHHLKLQLCGTSEGPFPARRLPTSDPISDSGPRQPGGAHPALPNWSHQHAGHGC